MFGAFKILVLIHDGETKSYLARHPSFDRAIMLHVLPKPVSAEYSMIVAGLESLPPGSRQLVLDRGELDGSSYFVTERILDFRSFPAWIEKNSVAAAPPTPPVPVPNPAPSSSPPGEFTRLFHSATTPSPVPSVQPLQPPSVQPPQPPAGSPPGEFTRMFSGVGAPAPLPVPSEPKKAGTFTKAFLALSDTNSGWRTRLAVPAASHASASEGRRLHCLLAIRN